MKRRQRVSRRCNSDDENPQETSGAAADIPTVGLEALLVNAKHALVDLAKVLRSLEPEQLTDLLPDLDEMMRLLSSVHDQTRSISKLYDADGQPRPKTLVVKTVYGCGPYGYEVSSSGSRRIWKYLGKAEPGVAEGVYPPGSALHFTKRSGRSTLVGERSRHFTNTSTVGKSKKAKATLSLIRRRSKIGNY